MWQQQSRRRLNKKRAFFQKIKDFFFLTQISSPNQMTCLFLLRRRLMKDRINEWMNNLFAHWLNVHFIVWKSNRQSEPVPWCTREEVEPEETHLTEQTKILLQQQWSTNFTLTLTLNVIGRGQIIVHSKHHVFSKNYNPESMGILFVRSALRDLTALGLPEIT